MNGGAPPFDRSIFINCPFDEAYSPILQAVAFCVVYLGFYPRLAPENADNAAARLDRIIDLVSSSKFGIHDLSRCRAAAAGELARMNMPFELGIDYACRRFADRGLNTKRILILEDKPYDYQRVLSDISGWLGGIYERITATMRRPCVTSEVGLSIKHKHPALGPHLFSVNTSISKNGIGSGNKLPARLTKIFGNIRPQRL